MRGTRTNAINAALMIFVIVQGREYLMIGYLNFVGQNNIKKYIHINMGILQNIHIN